MAQQINLSEDNNYGYACGLIRSKELKMLSAKDAGKLLESEPNEMITFLNEKGYFFGPHIEPMSKDVNSIIQSVLTHHFKEAIKLFQDESYRALLSLPFDYFNLKLVLKEELGDKLFQQESLYNHFNIISFDVLKKHYPFEEKLGLTTDMRNAYFKAKEAYNQSLNPSVIDQIIDKAMFDEAFKLIEEKNNNFIHVYYQLKADLHNIQIIFRLKSLNIDLIQLKEALFSGGQISTNRLVSSFNEEYEGIISSLKTSDFYNAITEGVESYRNTSSWGVLDKELNNCLLGYLKKGKMVSFGVEAVFAHFWALEMELQNLRIIFSLKNFRVDQEIIASKLRESYV